MGRFGDGLVRSLSWPRNLAALKKRVVAWDLYTVPEDAERAGSIAARLGIPVEIHAVLDGKPDPNVRKSNLLKALLAQMDRCIERKSSFFFAAPDAIFGDGSVESFLEIGSVPRVCVAAAPMRVVEEGFIKAMGDGPVSNARLVKLAFERMHPSFAAGRAGLPRTNTLSTGMSWRRISEGLYAVTYRTHSAYLLYPERQDVKWFRDRPKFGNYDWQFPKILVEQQRQRVIGSSDAAFVVELTTDAQDPATTKADPLEPDKFEKELLHHQVNRNVVCIWRAES